jgi:hypothetical protein
MKSNTTPNSKAVNGTSLRAVDMLDAADKAEAQAADLAAKGQHDMARDYLRRAVELRRRWS